MAERRLFFCIVLPIILAIPFSYETLGDVRLLPVFLGLSMSVALLNGLHFRKAGAIESYGLMLAYCFLVSSLVGEFEVFLAMIAFGWMVYWPVFIGVNALRRLDAEKLLAYFINLGLVLAAGLFLQIGLYRIYGIEFGKIDLVQERDAFGFIWKDYSFLSLFLVTLTPLCWRTSRRLPTKLVSTLVLVSASAATSARVGLFAIAIAIALVLIFKTIYALLSLTTTKKDLMWLAFALSLGPLIAYYVLELFPRLGSTDDSGRTQGYISALHFVSQNILFGSLFDVTGYKEKIETIPHNVFMYLLAVGGLVFLLLFLVWIVSFAVKVCKYIDSSLGLTLLMSAIGFQFIPAFFSAYYLAFIFSICLMVAKKKSAAIENFKFRHELQSH